MWAKSALVNVYPDGSIVVATPGAEIGQGLLTKVRCVWGCAAARELDHFLSCVLMLLHR